MRLVKEQGAKNQKKGENYGKIQTYVAIPKKGTL